MHETSASGLVHKKMFDQVKAERDSLLDEVERLTASIERQDVVWEERLRVATQTANARALAFGEQAHKIAEKAAAGIPAPVINLHGEDAVNAAKTLSARAESYKAKLDRVRSIIEKRAIPVKGLYPGCVGCDQLDFCNGEAIRAILADAPERGHWTREPPEENGGGR